MLALENQERQWLSLVREAVHEVRYGSPPAVRQESQQEKRALLQTRAAAAEPAFSSIVRLVNFILQQAAVLQASDIHLEPQAKIIRLRFRISGILQEVMQMPPLLGQAVVSRLKVMAGMDIAKGSCRRTAIFTSKQGAPHGYPRFVAAGRSRRSRGHAPDEYG